MKKKLLFTMGIAALAVSCTNEDFQNVEQEVALNASDNVVFTVTSVDSRGEFNYGEEGFYTGWNAEDDRIGVIASGVTLPKAQTPQLLADSNIWNFNADATRDVDTSADQNLTGYVYKATKSGSVGVFTSVDDENLLKFAPVSDPQVKASFRVFRPSTNSVTYDRTDDVETMAAAIPAFNTQNQSTVKAEFDNFFMVAEPINAIHSGKNAVGETIELSFERPFAALAIRTNGYDKEIFGNLKTVTVAAETSTLAYSNQISVDVAKRVGGEWAIDATGATASNSVTLNVGTGDGLEWSDNNYAYIQVMPVDRSEMPVAEEYTVTLTFANGSVTIDKSTANSWEPNDFIRVTCDLTAEDYLYFATNNSLLVNNAMPTVTGGNFKYGNSNIAATSIQTVVSNKVLTTAELAELNKMTGVKTLTLPNEASDLGDDMENINALTSLENLTLAETLEAPAISAGWTALVTLSCPKATNIPDAAYQNNNVITTAEFPLVQTIGDDAFNGAANITTIGCETTDKLIIGTTTSGVKSTALTTVGSFAFAGITGITSVDAPELSIVGSRAFGTSALGSLSSVLLPKYDFADSYNAIALLGGSNLVTVDLSSVSELGIETIAFAGNTALTTVTLKAGANVGKMAFKGCTALATVANLDKAASIGESAFEGCTAVGFTKVGLNAPVIGKNAFKGATNLATVTLGADVTTISEGAFNGCTALGTVNNLANIETIGKEAFKNTVVTAYNFLNAELGESAFEGASQLKGHVRSNAEVLEKNVFKGADLVSTFTFPEVTTIKEGALANLLNTSPYVTITFGSALEAIDAEAFCTPSGAQDGSTAAKAITGAANYNLILSDKTGLSVSGSNVTYLATDGKYYKITFASVQ